MPLAIQVGRKETYANLVSRSYCDDLLFSHHYGQLVGGCPSLRPDLMIWLPNLIFQGVGFWMIYRASRH